MAARKKPPTVKVNLAYMKACLLEAKREAETEEQLAKIHHVLRDLQGRKISKRVRELYNDLAKEPRGAGAES